MAKNFLIKSLNSAIIEMGNCEQVAILKDMRIKEMERILLEEKEWTAEKRIYTLATGYYKTKVPIQLCRAKKEDIIQKVYEYYFEGLTLSSLDDCFKKAMKDFAQDVQWKQRKGTSKSNYESNWERFFKCYPIAKKDISKIKNSDLINHLKRIVFELDLSRSGLKDAKTLLNKAYDYAVNNDLIQKNLAREISTRVIKCRKVNRSKLVYTDEEREKLLTLMERDDHVASAALALMFCLCIRSGEVRALKWSDVDWENETIHIHSQISREYDENGRNIYVDDGETKNHDESGNRHQKLSKRAVDIVKRQYQSSPFATYIFEYNGHVLEPNMLNRRLRKLCEMASIPYMSTHKIRFWSVTKMVKYGVSAVEVQAQAGHKCKQTTDYYVRAGRQNTLEASKVEEIYG